MSIIGIKHQSTFIGKKRLNFKLIYEQRYLFMMSVPFIAWVVLFRYMPLWGWIMAFQNFRPGRGFLEQEWVGFEHFIVMFQDPMFYQVMRNTLAMSFMSLIFGFTLPIVFALFLNEVRNVAYKRVIQTISYLPHFVSWVIVASLFSRVLSIDGGIINDALIFLNVIDEPIHFLSIGRLFWPIITAVEIWKSLGWNAIIYLAAISAIDPTLYEAAVIDGAGRFKQMRYITLPMIKGTIMIILIMSIGWLISIGFERQFLMGNALVMEYSKVLDLYILEYGINLGRFSFGTAAGVFRSVVSIILVLAANKLARLLNEEGSRIF